jgi:hypothetical protein
MRMTRKEALNYLQEVGYPMSEGTLGRIKAWLKKTERERLNFIAAIGFESQHLARIDMCENIEKLMWENYHKETSYYRKVMILKEIKELQPYISTYYEATKAVIAKPDGRGQESSSIPEDIVPAVE